METLFPNSKDPQRLQAYFGAGVAFVISTLWYNLNAASFVGFFFGIVCTLLAEAGIIFYFFNRKQSASSSSSQNTYNNIKVTLGDLNKVQKEEEPAVLQNQSSLVSPDSMAEIPLPPFIFDNKFVRNDSNDSQKFSDFDELDKSIMTECLDSPTFESKKMKKRLPEKSRFARQNSFREAVMGKIRRGDSRKEMVAKIGHKKFKRDLDQYCSMFDFISWSEEKYGKDLQSFPIIQDLSHASDEFGVQSLTKNEIIFLTDRFQKELKFNEVIVIPDWNKIKETLYFIGTIHFNLSSMTDKVSKVAIEDLRKEFETKYAQIKKQKSSVKKEHEEVMQYYIKAKSEHDSLQASLSAALSTYHEMVEERAPKESLLKHEMKTRLLEMQLNSAKNKLADASDKLGEKAKLVQAENTKINAFVEQRDMKRDLLYKNTCKSFIEGLLQKLTDAETILASLVQFKLKGMEFSSQSSLPAGPESIHVANKDLHKSQTTFSMLQSQQMKPKERKTKRFFKAIMHPLKRSQTKHMDQSATKTEDYENGFLNLCGELQERFEYYDHVQKELRVFCESETKKGRNNMMLLKYISQSLDKYIKEKNKIFSPESGPSSEGTQQLKFSKLIKDAISYTINNNIQLFQEIWNLENRHSQNLQFCEEQILNYKYVIQDKMKRLEQLIKEIEEKSGAPPSSLRKSIKKFFKKTSNESSNMAQSISLQSQNSDSMDKEEAEHELHSLEQDKLNLFADLDNQTAKLKDAVEILDEKNTLLKKQIVLNYFICYHNQKQHLTSLAEQVDRICETPPAVVSEEVVAFNVLSEAERQIENSQITSLESQTELKNLEIDFDVKNQKQPGLGRQDSQFSKPALDRVDSQFSIEDPLVKSNQKMANRATFETFWFNKMLDVFFTEWARSAYFREKMVKSILRSMNKRKQKYKFLKEMNVKEFIMEEKAPEIRQISLLPTDSKEFICDFDLSYEGSVLFEMEAKIEPQKVVNVFSKDYTIAMTARVLMKKLKGKIRICWKPSQSGASWFCFVGDPCIDVHIDPLLGHRLFNMTAFPKIESMIRERIAKKLNKLTFPHKKEIKLPLAFKSPE